MRIKTAFLHSHRAAIYSLAFGLVLATTAGLARLQVEANYRVYFDGADPLLALEASVNRRFAKSDSAILVLEAGQRPLLSPESMHAYLALERELRALPFVSSVSGFYRFAEPAEDLLGDDGKDLFAAADEEDGAIDSTPEGLWQRLLQHPRGQDLVSANRRYALIEVQVKLAGEDSAREVQQAMSQIRDLAAGTLLDSGAVAAINYSGVLALNHAYIDVVRHDLGLFVPGLLLLIGLVLWLVLRNWRLVLLPLVGGLLAATMAMGIAGWSGWTLAAINAFTPIIIVSLHLAASMHLVVGFVQYRADGLGVVEAVQRSLDFNLRAMSLSALTTAAGFLLLALSPSPPVRLVGYCVAMGVVFSWLLNVVVLPLQLARLKLEVGSAKHISARLNVEKFVTWLRRHARWVLVATFLMSLCALLSLSRMQINDSVYDYFPLQHPFSVATRQLDEEFAGCVRLSYVLSGNETGSALTDDFIQLQDRFVDWLQAQPEVGGVNGIVGLMARRGWDTDQARDYLSARSPAQIGIGGLLTPGLTASRVEVYLKARSSVDLIAFDRRAQHWLSAHVGDIQFEGGIGPDLIFAWLGQRNATSMFVSLIAALAGIGVLVGLLFRSPAMALLGLLCNLLPLLLVYALWFATGGYVSLGAAIVLGMIMGVIVDDTLHLLCKYRALRGQGVDEPVLEMSRRVLPAVFITSVTLAAGLSVGMLSDFRPLRELSMLSAGVILAALLVDALVLPAVLMLKRIKLS